MVAPKPLKRHKALQPLSREHHQGLLLCWKIKNGLKKEIAPERIKAYSDCIWDELMKPHFKIEEAEIFPILGDSNPLVKQALEEHQHLESLFTAEEQLANNLEMLANDLDSHIRFEERVLFQKIQETADAEVLVHIEEVHSKEFSCGVWDDAFWEKEAEN